MQRLSDETALLAVFSASRDRATHSGGRCRLQAEQQRWDQFRHGRMNRHRPAELIVRGLCIDGIEDAVDRLVAAGAENRRTKDLLRRGIGENLLEAESLVLLDRAADTR